MDFIFSTVLPIVRDVAVVILALESVVVGLVTLFLLLQIWRLIGVVRKHLDTLVGQASGLVGQASDVLNSTADAARNVRGTTTFVTDRAARPVIEVLSIVNAAMEFARAAFGAERTNGKKD